MKTKRLLIITSFLFALFAVSCSTVDFGSSINDLIGTEWTYKNSDGSLGLKIYANNVVSSFFENKNGIETISGTYEYFESTKTFSFKGLTWYYADTGKPAFTLNGAHVIDNKTLEVIVRTPDGEVGSDYLYRK